MPVDVKVEIRHDEGGESGVFLRFVWCPQPRWQSIDLSEVMDLGMADLNLVAADGESDFLNSIRWNLRIHPNFYIGSLEVNSGEKVG